MPLVIDLVYLNSITYFHVSLASRLEFGKLRESNSYILDAISENKNERL